MYTMLTTQTNVHNHTLYVNVANTFNCLFAFCLKKSHSQPGSQIIKCVKELKSNLLLDCIKINRVLDMNKNVSLQ